MAQIISLRCPQEGLRFILAALQGMKPEMDRHGPDIVFDNRVCRAEIFRERGDEEEAARLEQEAEMILEVV